MLFVAGGKVFVLLHPHIENLVAVFADLVEPAEVVDVRGQDHIEHFLRFVVADVLADQRLFVVGGCDGVVGFRRERL